MQKPIEQISAIIVLYNKNCMDSSTFLSVTNIPEINLIVCDNSTEDFHNQELVEKYGARYINMNGNQGLSKAYNRAIDSLDKNTGIICLFDDDSTIGEDYFDKLQSYTQAFDADVFLPIVYDGTEFMMSPCVMKGHKVHGAMNIGNLDRLGENISGINSGMAIRASVFQNYRYDENIFLDYIDHAFIRDMRAQKKKIKIMKDLVIRQSFSINENSKDSVLKRFRIMKKDLKYFYSKDIGSKAYYYWYILKLKVHLCLQYKTLKFLFI